MEARALGGPAAGWGALPKEERDQRAAARLERVRALGMKKMRAEDAAELVAPGTRAEVIQWIQGAEGLHVEGYAQAMRMLAEVDVPREAAGVKCPAKIVSGELDRRTPPETNARRIAAALPNASLVMVPNCGHLPHLEHPEKFNAVLLEMLEHVVHGVRLDRVRALLPLPERRDDRTDLIGFDIRLLLELGAREGRIGKACEDHCSANQARPSLEATP